MSAVCCQRSVCRADHSSRGFLSSVVCLSMIGKPGESGGIGPLGQSNHKNNGYPTHYNRIGFSAGVVKTYVFISCMNRRRVLKVGQYCNGSFYFDLVTNYVIS